MESMQCGMCLGAPGAMGSGGLRVNGEDELMIFDYIINS